MFLKESEITELTKCQRCKETYNVPLMLPCGENVCKSCLQMEISEDFETKVKPYEKFTCLICDEEHEMPNNGLAVNKPIMKALNLKPHEVSRGETVKRLKEDLKQLQERRNELSKMMESKDETLRNHYEMVRQQIYIVTESRHKEIDEALTELIKEVDEHEKKNLDFLAENSFEEEDRKMSEFVHQVDEFGFEWTKNVSKSQLSKAETTEAKERAIDLNK